MAASALDVCIIGGGLSGLAVAHFLLARQPALRLLLLEREERAGGTIRTYTEAGYQAEWGAHGFLDNTPESQRLVELAGVTAEVQLAPLKTFVRYVCLAGRLVCIPQHPLKVLTAPLMPLHAKIGVLRDLFRRPLPGDPSVAEWAAYRFGRAMLPFADAVYTGTYAGDIERLKIDATMPGVRRLEREHGSVIRGALHQLRRTSRVSGKAGRRFPAMISFARGMERLPQALAASLAARRQLRLGEAATALRRAPGGWEVHSAGGWLACRHLVVATSANAALPLLAGVPELGPPPLASLPEALLATVVLGFTHTARVPFGFGYLAPEREGRFALGTLFSSHMFPGRAPAGHQLLEALVGGRRHPERLELDDEQLVARTYADLRQLLPLPDPPCFARVLRLQSGIPQLEAGYSDLLAWRARVEAADPHLHICGFGWTGIGINDMSKEAGRVAARVAASLHGSRDADADGARPTEVRGIYV